MISAAETLAIFMTTDMTADEAIEYLTGLRSGDICPGLERIRDLLSLLNDPQKELRFIHIAGTNGKGSTAAFISGILKECGLRVGKYTSPAVFDYRERFRIGKRNISKEDLVRGTLAVRSAIEKMTGTGAGSPSSFEAETALAFWYFREKECDVVVLETGMGGFLDATNIIPAPLAAVFASISFDHMAFLGDTLESIATQKAGIIKKGCIVVSAKQHPEAEKVIKSAAEKNGCPYIEVDPEAIRDRRTAKDSPVQIFDYKSFKELKISLLGKYQLINAALAIETVLALKSAGLSFTGGAVKRGLSKAVWPGRFEKISDKPCIIIDGAHNEEAALRLKESLDFYFTNRPLIYIMGMLKDKECDKVCEIMAGRAACIFTVNAGSGTRARSAIELAGVVKRFNSNVTAADSYFEALEMARGIAGKEGAIIVFGSLSFLGEIRRICGSAK